MKPMTKSRLYLVLGSMLAAWCMAACASDFDPGTENPETPPVTSDQVSVGFSVDNMTYGSFAATRAGEEGGEGTDPDPDDPDTDEHGHKATSAEEHETLVDHVYFIFFGSNNRFVTYQRAAVEAGSTKVTFPVPGSLQNLTDYQVVMVANADFYPPVGYATFEAFLNSNTTGKTITQFKEVLAIGVDHTMNHNTDQYLPMEGRLVNESGSQIPFNYDVVEGRYVANGAILFERQVARIDLNNYAPSVLDIKWVKICNYRNTTYVSRAHYTGGTVQAAISDEAPEDQLPHYIAVDEAETVGDIPVQQVRHSLYAFPNSIAKPSQDDAVTTYIMIAGKYKDDENISYYRFNLNRGSDAQYLDKNHIYTANIMGVKGPGAPTESAARLTDAAVLMTTVESTWEDDSSNTDADASGNFLILSKTSLSFQGDDVRTQNITVKVREGMQWKWEYVTNTGNSNQDFGVSADFTKNTLSVKALTHNNTNFVKYGYLKVSGLTADGKILSVKVNITQLSVNDDVKMLTVNGQTGTIEPKISGTGTTFLYQVQTGSATQGWYCEVEKGQEGNWTPWAAAGASYTKAGGNKGFLEIVVPANISGDDREITLVVYRKGVTVEEVPPVKIKLTQPKSKMLLSVFPYPQNGTLVINGFLNEPKYVNQGNNEERTNSFSVQKDIFVTLADPVKYQYKVESNFDWYRDLRLSQHVALMRYVKMEHPALTTANMCYQKFDNMTNGQKFYLNVFRTGPGDPDIVGTIRITAYPKAGYTGESQTINFDVRITTDCEIGDVMLKANDQYYMVSDRNVGAVPRLNGTAYTPALNYAAQNNIKITNSSAKTDNDNKLFSGSYYTYYEMYNAGWETWVNQEFLYPNLDPNKLTSPFYTRDDEGKWEVPDNLWINHIWSNLQWSKMRPYLVSEETHNGKYVACFIPRTAYTENTVIHDYGHYWTRSRAYDGYGYLRRITLNDFVDQVYIYNNPYYYGTPTASVVACTGCEVQWNRDTYSVRCMRFLDEDDVNTYRTWLKTH